MTPVRIIRLRIGFLSCPAPARRAAFLSRIGTWGQVPCPPSSDTFSRLLCNPARRVPAQPCLFCFCIALLCLCIAFCTTTCKPCDTDNGTIKATHLVQHTSFMLQLRQLTASRLQQRLSVAPPRCRARHQTCLCTTYVVAVWQIDVNMCYTSDNIATLVLITPPKLS